MSGHNKNISLIIKNIQRSVDTATTQEDLRSAILPAVKLNNDFKYHHKQHWIAVGIMVLFEFWIVNSYMALYVPHQKQQILLTLGSVLLIGIISLLVLIGCRLGTKRNLSNKIAVMDALLDHDINPRPTTLSFVNGLKNTFQEFSRGNYSRQFISDYETNENAAESFHCYKFEYVDKVTHTETKTDSNGNTRTETETEYKHYYRYGLVFDFRYFENITITSDFRPKQKSSYKPSSIEFNKKYTLGAIDTQKLSRFLKPAVVEALLNIQKSFTNLNVEINSDGLMCVSFADDNVLKPNNKFSIDSPVEFYNELEEKAKLPKLNTVLDFYHTLKRHSDNNFQQQELAS